MTKPPTAKPSIAATLEDQHRKTMKVVRAIKADTEILVRRANSSHRQLADQTPLEDQAETGIDPVPGHAEPETQHGIPETPLSGRMDETPDQAAPRTEEKTDQDQLKEEVTKRAVSEVMKTISPVLTALDTFIQANSIDAEPQPAEPDDDQFAEKLIEQMKLAIGRRQRIAEKIAMARLKRSNS